MFETIKRWFRYRQALKKRQARLDTYKKPGHDKYWSTWYQCQHCKVIDWHKQNEVCYNCGGIDPGNIVIAARYSWTDRDEYYDRLRQRNPTAVIKDAIDLHRDGYHSYVGYKLETKTGLDIKARLKQRYSFLNRRK